MSEPSITVTLEPLKALGLVSFLRLAPSSQGGAETGYVNLGALIKNTGTAALLVTMVEVSVPNSSTPAKSWTMTLPGPPSQPLAHNASVWWTQNEDYLFAIPSRSAVGLPQDLDEHGHGSEGRAVLALRAHQ